MVTPVSNAQPTARPSKTKRALGAAALVVFSTVATLAVLEGVLRIAGVGRFHTAAQIQCVEPRSDETEGPVYTPHGVLRITYPSNPRGYFDADNALSAHINNLGFRGPDTTIEKPPGELRVAVLGDSFAFGYGVKDGDTFPAVMARKLNTLRPTEVLNFGVTGATPQDELRYLSGYVLQFSPDVILWTYFLNDADLVNPQRFIDREPALLVPLRRHSYLANWTLGMLERWQNYRAFVHHYRQGYQPDSPGWLAAQKAILDAKHVADKHGIRFLLTVYPILYWHNGDYPFQVAHTRLFTFCQDNGIPMFDLLSVFKGQNPYALWVYPADQHPNEVAQGEAGDALASFVINQVGKEPTP